MKQLLTFAVFAFFFCRVNAQGDATVREYKKTFRTYGFSDPDSVPEMSKIYPYFRFDGYTNVPVNKEWKVVELENDYIKVMVLPEIGGKIWTAIEKSSNKPFIYYNEVVKFRDVAMRGPWTSGGLEPNYGIVGHTPNCATPVDYTVVKHKDGSVSCVVGVLDLLTRSVWRVDIRLEKDKAYFTTNSTWYNSSPFEQPYYHWMNGALKAADDLHFVFPGNRYLGHEGESSTWPKDEKGTDLSYYRNNNFGSYKSYHVFGKHSNFWGAYYDNEDFGMARYSTYDDKAGKKIWIWGLSREGMIWEKLLTDNNGQYVEVQSGRLFNQPAEGSSFTPFKNRGFTPNETDQWTEYWFPVKNTKGLVAASDYGSLNVKQDGNTISIYFMPVQPVADTIRILSNGKLIYQKGLNLRPMQLFYDSISMDGQTASLRFEIGRGKLTYDAAPGAGNLSRPFVSPGTFNWNSLQGLHLQGKEFIRQRMYSQAEEKLRSALKADSNYLPALADFALLMFRQMRYDEAIAAAKRALAIDAYDPASNYYFGLINEHKGNATDAKDGFSIASQSAEFRTAAFTRLALISHRERSADLAVHYAQKAIQSNREAFDAWQLLALIHREQHAKDKATAILDTLENIDPLNHFARFERLLLDSNAENKNLFLAKITNEMPGQTMLELALWYFNAGNTRDARKLLELAGAGAEIEYWKAYLDGRQPDESLLTPDLYFPFRHETAAILDSLVLTNEHWLLKYHLALIRWNGNQLREAQRLFTACGETPRSATFYAARGKFMLLRDTVAALADIRKAYELDGKQWRFGRALINYYLSTNRNAEARTLAASEHKKYPQNYMVGMLYSKALIADKKFDDADKVLSTLSVLPNEGATAGRALYRDTKLMLAIRKMQAGNYKKALQYISASREWPERLGSGKPYEQDLDERLQDWLEYHCHLRMNNQAAAKRALTKITSYSSSAARPGAPSLGNLISALAFAKIGDTKNQQRFSMSNPKESAAAIQDAELKSQLQQAGLLQ
jgi:Tfp pilus assembly protein PilF